MHPSNDPNATAQERLDALKATAQHMSFCDWVVEANNHIHTCYSFSPYTPAGAVLNARKAGLRVVGSVDHDSLAGAAEMQQATKIFGMGVVTGFEVRAFMPQRFADRKLNNPDSTGIAYLTVQGIPAAAREQVRKWLDPVRQARLARTMEMAKQANAVLTSINIPSFDLEQDLLAQSQFSNGGTITERHLLAAMARQLISGFGRGPQLVSGLAQLGLIPTELLRSQLADPANPHLVFDLLGLLKSNYLNQIYLSPTRIAEGGECYEAHEVVAFAHSIGAIATYAYLGDVTTAITGDKKAEQFEDEFLEELIEALVEIGFRAITYMPPRNTDAQINRIHALANTYGLLEISGVDINNPRQQFTCPALRRSELASLNEATWALVAHEMLTNYDRDLRLIGDEKLNSTELIQRITKYAPLGRALADGAEPDQIIAKAKGSRS